MDAIDFDAFASQALAKAGFDPAVNIIAGFGAGAAGEQSQFAAGQRADKKADTATGRAEAGFHEAADHLGNGIGAGVKALGQGTYGWQSRRSGKFPAFDILTHGPVDFLLARFFFGHVMPPLEQYGLI